MVKTTISDKIINFLKEDLIQNLNILGILENAKDTEIYVDDIDNPKGVLVNNGYFNYIYTKEDSFIDDILNTHCKKEGFYGFSGLEEGISKKLRPHFINQWESPCDLYYLPESNYNPSLKINETKVIDINDAEKIDHYYTYRDDESIYRIKNDIKSRPSSGVYKDGEIVCWVLVHEDNSMGIMYTMEEHRGKGYAVDVTVDLCGKILSQGKIPFLQINRHNNMSPGLARKCGLVKVGSAIWFGGIKGIPKEIYDSSNKLFNNIQHDFNNDLLFASYVVPEESFELLFPFLEMKEYDKKIDGFELSKVSNDDEVKIWCHIAAKGSLVKVNDFEEFKSSLYTAIISNRNNYELYLGKIHGDPVSTVGISIIENEAAGLCYLNVLPELRDREIDNLTAYEVLLTKKKEEWGILTIRTNKSKLEFFKSLGGIEMK